MAGIATSIFWRPGSSAFGVELASQYALQSANSSRPNLNSLGGYAQSAIDVLGFIPVT